jgi:hypothetical protein
MCSCEKTGCRVQEKLKGKPEASSPAQIKECHGKETDHPCVDFKKEKE